MNRIWLIGGSGLVGSFVEAKLAARGLVSFGRRTATTDFQRQIDFDRLPDLPGEAAACQTAISCLGTTIKTAGSEAAMRRVDHDYVMAFAQAARAAGARHFILVSSTMADPGASSFYLRLKGETERDVLAAGFARVDIVRPGLLLGERREFRPVERFAAMLSPVLKPLMIGAAYRYRPIAAATVADAIAHLTEADGTGVHFHENRAIERLART